jgi:hypothetical protein
VELVSLWLSKCNVLLHASINFSWIWSVHSCAFGRIQWQSHPPRN